MKARTTRRTLRDVQVEALVDKTADTLQEVRVRLITAYSATRRDLEVKAEAVLNALSHTLEEMKPGKFDDTPADVEGIAHKICS